jgi:transcriptional regulator with XRE-family HTH domain
MPSSAQSEIKRRVRAAWTYSGLSQSELAKKAGIKSRTLGGYLATSRPQIPDYETRARIAEACDVPPSFLEEGFSSGEQDDPAARLEALEDRLAEIPRLRATVDALVSVMDRQLAERVRADAERALRQESGTTGRSDRHHRA